MSVSGMSDAAVKGLGVEIVHEAYVPAVILEACASSAKTAALVLALLFEGIGIRKCVSWRSFLGCIDVDISLARDLIESEESLCFSFLADFMHIMCCLVFA